MIMVQILRWRDNFELFVWNKCNHKGLYNTRQEFLPGHIKVNENEITTSQYRWNILKVGQRGKCIALCMYI